MALSSGILVLIIGKHHYYTPLELQCFTSVSSQRVTDSCTIAVGIITAGIVAVVAIVAIYLCAKIAIKMSLQEERGAGEASISDEPGAGSTGGGEADGVEMGSMSYFIEDIQKERPVRFSSQQLRAFTQSYAHKVGSGGFGVVYKGRFPDGAPVAVKVLNSTLGKRAEEQFMAEVGTIGRTYHINLVRLYGFCFDATVKALVYEYLENGSLDGYLFDPPPERKVIRFGKLHEIAVGTARALRYLHEECAQRIIHYDIKPENVLLGADLAPKVSDFGLARLCDREDTHLTITGARGTPGYAAPELWMPLPVTHKCDVYSYGMLLFEMLGRRRNLDLGLHARESQEWYPRWVWHRLEAGDMSAVLARAVAAGDEKEREAAERVCKVALWCVQYRPEDRPSMSGVVRMLEGEDQIAAPRNPFAHLGPYSGGQSESRDTTTLDTYGSSGHAPTAR
ncbi:hypothetical protein ACP4OV_026116 [Aristida adscensionis]